MNSKYKKFLKDFARSKLKFFDERIHNLNWTVMYHYRKYYHSIFPSLSFYIYIYIVIHRQIYFVRSELISVARRARFPKLRSKPGWLKCQSKILPLSYEEASTSEVNLNDYESQLLLFTYFRFTATESSIHMKNLTYTLMATQLLHSLESSTLQG